jgi:hypothetical protein
VPNTEDYALVVGIREYETFPELSAAEGDALAFADWLCSPGGGDVPRGQVEVIVSGQVQPPPGKKGVYPIKDDVDGALTRILNKPPGRIGRRFYFYFSGHGCVPSADETLLLVANTTLQSMGRNIGADPYKKWLQNGALFDELVFILDCCRGFDNVSAPALGPLLTSIGQSPDFFKVKTFVAMGTEFGHYSFAPDVAGERSFFTKYLLEGLSGKAAAADGAITAKGLSDYVTPRVKADALKAGRTQVPDIPIKPDLVFKPGDPGKQSQRLLSFTIPPEWNRPVELQDGLFQPIQRTNGTDRKFQAVLAPGLYQIKYPADAAAAEPVAIQTLRVNPSGASGRVTLDPGLDPKGFYNV